MKSFAVAFSLVAALAVTACGGGAPQDSSLDDLASQADPISTYAAAKALAETQPNVHQAVALHLNGSLVGHGYSWSWTFADKLNQVVIAVTPHGLKVASTMHQIDYLGPNPIDPAHVKLHPADVLSVCKKQGYTAAPVELDLARALTKSDADWYVELGAQGSLRVNAATGLLGK